MPKVAALMHIFYDNTFGSFKDDLLNLKKYDTTFLFSVSQDCINKDGVISELKHNFPEAFIIETPNIGKDIGGKLALIDLYLRLKIQSDYILLLHDKLSPQALNGEEWRDKLLKIIKKDNLEQIFSLFQKDSTTGVIATKECIANEYFKDTTGFSTVNNDLLKKYIDTYDLKTTDFEFVGGTMFWVRSNIIVDFFSKHAPLEIRKNLEAGNVLDNLKGTHTHTIERILSFIAGNYGYKIHGI